MTVLKKIKVDCDISLNLCLCPFFQTTENEFTDFTNSFLAPDICLSGSYLT